MVLDWSTQGSSLVGIGDTGAGPIKFSIAKTPEGYGVGIYSGQNLLATETFSSMEEARSWAEQAFAQIPTSKPQSPSQIVASPSSPPKGQIVASSSSLLPPPSSLAPSGLGASKDSGLTTSRIAAASLGGRDTVLKPSGSFTISKPKGGSLI